MDMAVPLGGGCDAPRGLKIALLTSAQLEEA